MKFSMKRTLSLALALTLVLSLFVLPMQVHAATLKTGSSGTAVKQLQMNLIGLGYMSGSANGVYNAATVRAVERYQNANNLKADGIAGSQTLSSIRSKVKQLQMNLIGLGYLSGSADGVYGPATTKAVKKYQAEFDLTVDGIAGSKTLSSIHKLVRRVQRSLQTYGYLSGSADGIYGSATKAAVRRYQYSFGLKVDGIAGSKTRAKLLVFNY